MKNEELIDRYLQDGLTAQEQKVFDDKLAKDPSFKEALVFQEDLKKIIAHRERSKVRKQLEQLQNLQQEPPEVNKVRRLYPWVVAAASIAAILVIMLYVLNPIGQQVDYDALYAENFSPYENIVQPIQRGNELQSLEKSAFEAYDTGNYERAAELFGQLQQEMGEDYLHFYRGISLMQLDEHQQAVDELQTYVATDGVLRSRAQWYLALSHLKLDQPDKTTEYLKRVIDAGDFKTQTAQELLNQLD